MNDRQIYKNKRQEANHKKYQRITNVLNVGVAGGSACILCLFLIFVVLLIFDKPTIIPLIITATIITICIIAICIIIAMYLDTKLCKKLKTELSEINE